MQRRALAQDMHGVELPGCTVHQGIPELEQKALLQTTLTRIKADADFELASSVSS
jgi:hypothetical protein